MLNTRAPVPGHRQLIDGYKAGGLKFACLGGAGGGKTTATAHLAMGHALKYPMAVYAIVAQSVMDARALYVNHLVQAAKSYGISARPGMVEGKPGLTAGPARFVFFGSNKPGSISQIAGWEITGYVIDEATHTDELYYDYLETRLRGAPHCLQLVSYNRLGPSNWVRAKIDDKAVRGEQGWQAIMFHPFDNPYTPPEFKERLAALDGYMRERFLEGNWASAEGLVYPYFLEGDIPDYAAPTTFGVDYGDAGVTAAVKLVGTGSYWVAADEYVHDNSRGLVKESDQLVVDMINRFGEPQGPYYIDHSPTLRRSMERYGRRAFLAHKDLDNDFAAVNYLLQTGQVRIAPAARLLRAELETLSIDPKTGKPASGQADHLTDAFRYACMGLIHRNLVVKRH